MDGADGTTVEDVRADFRILGPLRVVLDGAEVTIATRRQRALLVLLLMSVGRVVPTERLIDQLWDGEPPPQGAVTLRSYVVRPPPGARWPERSRVRARDARPGLLRRRTAGER